MKKGRLNGRPFSWGRTSLLCPTFTSCRDRHGGAAGFAFGQFAVHGALVIFFFAQSQVEDVKHIEHTSEHVVQAVAFPKVLANSKMVRKKKYRL